MGIRQDSDVLSIIFRSLFFHVLVDWVFSFLVTVVLFLLLGWPFAPELLLIYAIFFTCKQLFFTHGLWKTVRLFSRYEDASNRGDAQLLRATLKRLDRWPRIYRNQLSTLWLLGYPTIAAFVQWYWVVDYDFGVDSWGINLLMTAACVFGSSPIYPLSLSKALQPAYENISRQVYNNEKNPDQRFESLRSKLLIYNVSLFFTTSFVFMTQALTLLEARRCEISIKKTELALEDLVQRGRSQKLKRSSLPTLSGLRRLEKTTLVRLDSSEDVLQSPFSACLKRTLGQAVESRERGSVFSRRDHCVVSWRNFEGGLVLKVAPLSSTLTTTEIGIILLFMFTFLVYVVQSSLFFSGNISTPIVEARAFFQKLMTDGHFIESEFVPVHHHDDLGLMILSFNKLLESLKKLALQTAEIKDGNLLLEIEGRGDLPDAFRAMVLAVRGNVRGITEESKALSMVGGELLASSLALERASSDQAQSVQEVSILMEDLNHGIERVSQLSETILQSAEDSRLSAVQTLQQINEFDQKAQLIQELLAVISKISRQTRMLSLNASIESARAGEAGAAFLVLAGETKTLSTEVTKLVSEIRSQVEVLFQSSQVTINAAEASHNLAEETERLAQEVYKLSLEQSDFSAQIADRVHSFSATIAETATNSQESRLTSEKIDAGAQRLVELGARFKVVSD